MMEQFIDLGFHNKSNNFNFFDKLKNNEFSLLYLIGSDNLDFDKKNEFIIYQGSHGDRLAQIADIILPSPAFTEQNGSFINLEGRLQKAVKATYPPGASKEDWKIFNLISKKLNDKELFRSFNDLRNNTLEKIKKNSNYDSLPNTDIKDLIFEEVDFISNGLNIRKIDYYFSNAIARSSKTMSDCRIARSENLKNKTAI